MRPVRWSGKQRETAYERWGGAPFFEALVDRFYQGVENDPRLRPMYPDDLADSRRHLALFLGQYWGGPADYDALRGAPRLRLRHAPFTVGPAEAEAWMEHMTEAVESAPMEPADRGELLEYFAMAARNLVNSGP